jgi:hypothetical protein
MDRSELKPVSAFQMLNNNNNSNPNEITIESAKLLAGEEGKKQDFKMDLLELAGGSSPAAKEDLVENPFDNNSSNKENASHLLNSATFNNISIISKKPQEVVLQKGGTA